MRIRKTLQLRCLALLAAFTLSAAAQTASPSSVPHLVRKGATQQLIVDGQPYLVLGGELHNSSSTSRDYMRAHWPKLREMNLNTVLAAVPWNVVEPVEGKFDFTMVDHLIDDARAHQLRLVLLWFGSWKNGLSHYVPTWVEEDTKRFPRARTASGVLEILTPLGEASRQADAAAFAALMRHVRRVDEQQRTVIMIQVENEVGLHTDARDRAPLANERFQQPVPRELMEALEKNKDGLLAELRAVWARNGFKTAGTWPEVFGADAVGEEVFQAWHYARYVDAVAQAGKSEYALPMFVNAWIVQPEDETPGDYPSGGPQAHVLDIWRAAAPNIDLLCPDIYLPNFAAVCESFTRAGNTLFVPEARAGIEGAANAVVAIGRFNAIGYSPFGIESREASSDGPMGRIYRVLNHLAPLILQHQASGSTRGFVVTAGDTTQSTRLGDFVVRASLPVSRRGGVSPERGYAIVIQTAPREFVAAGADIELTFSSAVDPKSVVGLADVEEELYRDGKWVRGRNLNGDEIMISYDLRTQTRNHQTGTGIRLIGSEPTIQKARVYTYQSGE